MRKLIAMATALVAFNMMSGSNAKAVDLDKKPTQQQVALAKDLPASLVVRVDERTNEVAVLHSYQKLGKDAATRDSILKKQFTPMTLKGAMTGQPPQDMSADLTYPHYGRWGWGHYGHYGRYGHYGHYGVGYGAWRFALGLFDLFRPHYYYYGYYYPYSPYYGYRWGPYRYYYYHYPYYWW